MTGLLVKDICLLRNRKQAFLLFVGILVLMGFSGDTENLSAFLIGYGTMLFGIFGISTLSYDEYDNSYPFLFTLPITKKVYVQEKFLFTCTIVAFGWLMSLVIGAIVSITRGELGVYTADMLEMISVLPMFVAIITIMIPVELKYGIEKSRIVLAMLAGAVFAIAMVAKMVGSKATPKIIEQLNHMSDAAICAALVVIALIVFAVSYLTSLKIVENKEF